MKDKALREELGFSEDKLLFKKEGMIHFLWDEIGVLKRQNEALCKHLNITIIHTNDYKVVKNG